MAPGEQWFLNWLKETDRPARELAVPLGDDAAVWRLASGEQVVLAADAIAEGTHFSQGEEPFLVGRKALAVNLSDLAAMGAKPLCALATCALPHGFSESMATEIVRGLRETGERYGCPLVGGDTVTHEGGVVLSVSVMGAVLPGGPVSRSGARPGELIAVTGAFGGSLLRGRHLRFEPRLREGARLLDLGPPSAMMDVSDGLMLDLFRLADASGVGFEVDGDRVPVHDDALLRPGDPVSRALGDGEDFELLFTAPPDLMEALLRHWDLPTPITVIGTVQGAGRILVRAGQKGPASPLGYTHE